MGTDGWEVHTLRVDAQGRVTLPLAARRRLGVEAGDRVIVIVDREGVRLMSLREQVAQMAGMFRDVAPGRSLGCPLPTGRASRWGFASVARS